MKNKYLAATLILTMVVLITSCATSKKYGCPMVQVKAKTTNI